VATYNINAAMVMNMFLAGAKNLEAKKEWINELNVFPVPDGDTGTNMTMTIMSAAKEVSSLADVNMQTVSKAISSGSLRGARGNSGVILSQLIRGFTKGIKEHDELDAAILADAFDKAVDTAYKAVMKPKEGTILTVAKGGALKLRELVDAGETDLDILFEEIIKAEQETLERTSDMLPVLKQAGVVDSGGQGLVEVLHGAHDLYLGKEVDLSLEETSNEAPKVVEPVEEELKYVYSTAFVIRLNKTFNIKMEMDFKDYLESIGDSIECVTDDDNVSVKVNTNDPGLALQKALKYGQLSNVVIENLKLGNVEIVKTSSSSEKAEVKEAEMPHKEVGFITVSIGEGMNEIFKGLGVDYIIEGGQTMNPSTEDMLNAIEKVNADTIFILPNNKNIILAANQAAGLVEDKKIVVIPTKTVPQGITAVINFVPDLSVEENVENMTNEIGNVKTGQVTYAVRDTVIDDKEIKQGDFMGIGDSGILSVGKDMKEVTIAMIDEMQDDETSLVSIYFGSDVTEDDATAISDAISDKYGDIDVELQNGGQPIYYYIVSVE